MSDRLHCDLLLTNAKYLSPDMTVISGKAIAVEDGRILDILDQDKCACQAGAVLDGGDLLWIDRKSVV